ncbi:MAG: hypothetical protein IKJ41_07450 [Clostridia bacterium]|nr:hypothetical protein [Clostridia bacterium]
MIKNNNIKRITTRLVSAILCFCLAAGCLSSCSKQEESGVRTVKSDAARNTIINLSDDASVHYSQSEESFSVKAATSGLIELLVDPETNSFAVRETTQNQLFTALPLLNKTADGEKLVTDASMVSLKIVGGTDIYYLNSQDNSVAYGKASYISADNGITFIFDIFANEETAAKSSYEKTDIGFNVTVSAILKDGSMTVTCTNSNITGNPDAYIEDIELLNYFGAYNDTREGDFMLVPDGCGAIIKTSIYDESFESLSFDVYGSDPSVNSEDKSESAIVPAFGIKHGNAAFVSLIQSGDAVASIIAKKATQISEYNIVYPSFNITPVRYENNTLYISKSSTVSEISLCYRFLAGGNATYAGLASACREQLIRNSVLSTKTVKVGDYMPFYLTLTGSAKKSLGPVTYLSNLTNFEQAKDMLTRMKNKGINNISVRYSGVFSGGLDSKDIVSSDIMLRLGGTEKLSELYDYVSSQKMTLYIDINLLSSSSGFSGSSATDICKNTASFTPRNSLVDFMGEAVSERQLRSIRKLKNIVASVLSDTRYYAFSGYCLNDAGSVLYSDFSHNGLLRDEAAEAVNSAISPLSTGHSVMAVRGNFYMLKNVDSVINIPIGTSIAQSGAYQAVPFVQLILHGIADYAGDPINTGINLRETILKNIEYGACPHFEWNYESVIMETENDRFYYDNTINAAAEFYTEANEALNDLRDARITDHYEVEDGIFCTEYDTGARIYVNYTNTDFSILGVVVEARNFLRVN